MQSPCAWLAYAYNPTPLINNTQVKIVEVTGLNLGNYIVNAKTLMSNFDGDPQDGSCQLVARALSGGICYKIDNSRVRLPGSSTGTTTRQTVALQGVLCTPDVAPPFSLEVDCGTYSGQVNETALTIVSVGNPVQGDACLPQLPVSCQ